jgi:hypothetical protein
MGTVVRRLPVLDDAAWSVVVVTFLPMDSPSVLQLKGFPIGQS